MENPLNFDKMKDSYMLEEHRIESFKDWPFDESAACSVSKMAEAGFYWSGNEHDKDSVTCFVCLKSLDDWKSTDDPWAEHRKHAPQCRFVKYGYKEADLTVEKFLDIFGDVCKNQILQCVERQKKKLAEFAKQETNKFNQKK